MKCPKCGSENSDSAKFCKNCGEKLASNNNVNEPKIDKDKKILLALIVIALILLVGVLLYAGGVFGPQVELKTQQFDGFQLDVPVDSKFVLTESHTTDPKNVFVSYWNDGGSFFDLAGFIVGMNVTEDVVDFDCELVENDGDLKVYKNDSDDIALYKVLKEGDDANICVMGSDPNTLKRIANTFKDHNFKKLATTASAPKTVQSSQPASSSTPSSISILGGSFSTGSGEADKTYARINVGTAHAGEDVIVQIFYSRDGNSLNHGNMVPATVHQDGYLEIASADAYHYYPDFAEINIYDSNSHLLTSKSVSLSPSAGTQTF